MILLDTHTLVWLDEGSERLGKKSLSHIDRSLKAGELFVSVISFWEVAMLSNKGRIDIQIDLNLWRKNLLDSGLQELAMSGDIAMDSANLIDFYGDPADRMIVASSRYLNAKLYTADEKTLAWKHELIRFDARK